MSLTFTSWTACTDAAGTPYTLDWTDEAAVRGTYWRRRLEALRQALAERYLAISLTTPAWLQTEIEHVPPVEHTLLRSWTASFDAAIDSLLPLYADNTRPTGTDYTGLADSALALTEAVALTRIGAAARVRYLQGMPPGADWVYQQYRLLQLMTHGSFRHLYLHPLSGIDPTPTERLTVAAAAYREISGAASWAAALAGFNAAAWQVVAPGDQPPAHYATHYPAGFGGPESWDMYRLRHEYTLSPRSSAIAREVDAYITGASTPRVVHHAIDVHQDHDHPAAEDALVRVTHQTTPNTDPTITATVGDFGDATVTEPASDTRRGWAASTVWTIARYDVTGGFTFQ